MMTEAEREELVSISAILASGRSDPFGYEAAVFEALTRLHRLVMAGRK